MITKKIYSGVLCYDEGEFTDPRRNVEYYGLSTDTKPTGEDIDNAAVLYEMDTGNTYLYDKTGETWLLQ